MKDDRMSITDGKVRIEGGSVQGIDFQACVITLGPGARLFDCTVDELSEIRTEEGTTDD